MSHKERLKEWTTTAILLLFFFAARSSFANHYHVPSGSMLPSIQLGDHIFTNRMAYDLKFPFTDWVLAHIGEPERGDVVVFRYPKDESQTYVKRLIGLPGDKIELRDGLVYVNGQLEDQAPQKSYPHPTTYPLRDQSEWIVPADSYFMMGDNRGNSADSRDWGFVKRQQVLGKATYRLWNFKLDTPPFLAFKGFGDSF